MNSRKMWASLSIVLLLVFVVGMSNASIAKRMGLGDLVKASSVIVGGRVQNIQSYYTPDKSMIFTDILINVEDVFKGSSEKAIILTILGGTVEGVTTTVVGSPRFCESESIVLFLNRFELMDVNQLKHYSLVGLSQGKFIVSSPQKGNTRVLMSDALNGDLQLLPDDQGVSVPPGGANGITIRELINVIDAEKSLQEGN